MFIGELNAISYHFEVDVRAEALSRELPSHPDGIIHTVPGCTSQQKDAKIRKQEKDWKEQVMTHGTQGKHREISF
jgi:hypothetical protein